MIKDFLGIPFTRVGESSRMWFNHYRIAEELQIGTKALWDSMVTSSAAPFRMLHSDVADMRIDRTHGRGLDKTKRSEALYDLDFLLACIFRTPTQKSRRIRDWVTYSINNLCYDGFVALRPYQLPVEQVRAITAKVCGVSHYSKIPMDRYDPTDAARGTNKAPTDCSPEEMLNPDNYITRAEITEIKALDLAIHLLLQYVIDEADAPKLFELLELDLSAGEPNAEVEAEVAEWLSKAERDTADMEL